MSIQNRSDENQIIKVSQNSSLSVNDDCEVFSNICANVHAYNQANVCCKKMLEFFNLLDF